MPAFMAISHPATAVTARHQLVSLCEMWEQVCLEKQWHPCHQTAYPNAVNVLSDSLAWPDHLHQQVKLMCKMWQHVCSQQGWQPAALPQYLEAMAFISSPSHAIHY